MFIARLIPGTRVMVFLPRTWKQRVSSVRRHSTQGRARYIERHIRMYRLPYSLAGQPLVKCLCSEAQSSAPTMALVPRRRAGTHKGDLNASRAGRFERHRRICHEGHGRWRIWIEVDAVHTGDKRLSARWTVACRGGMLARKPPRCRGQSHVEGAYDSWRDHLHVAAMALTRHQAKVCRRNAERYARLIENCEQIWRSTERGMASSSIWTSRAKGANREARE